MTQLARPAEEEAERLIQARLRRGLGDAKATATYFGWKYNTYIQHERGLRGLRRPVAEKYAKALRVSASWLMTGEGDPGWDKNTKSQGGVSSRVDHVIVDRELLKRVVQFVLEEEGVPRQRAALIADIVPEALSGPPVDVVDKDPFLSFRVHYQLEAQRS